MFKSQIKKEMADNILNISFHPGNAEIKVAFQQPTCVQKL